MKLTRTLISLQKTENWILWFVRVSYFQYQWWILNLNPWATFAEVLSFIFSLFVLFRNLVYLFNHLFPLLMDGLKSVKFFIVFGCIDCGQENTLKPGDVIQCRECGYRILYKKRTRRSTELFYFLFLIDHCLFVIVLSSAFLSC